MQVAYVGILQDILDIDCYPCLPFKQLGLSGIAACKCLILQTVRLDWCWGDKLQYMHLGLMFSSHSRVVHVGIFNTWTHLRVIHILHSVFLKKKISLLCYRGLQVESSASCHHPVEMEKCRLFRWCLFLIKTSHHLNALAWNACRNQQRGAK